MKWLQRILLSTPLLLPSICMADIYNSFGYLVALGVDPGPGVQLPGAYASDVDFSGTDLRDANFKGSTLDYSTFDRSNVTSADFTNASLWHTSFREADLAGARLDNALILWADFSDSKGLTEAQLKTTLGYRTRVIRGVNLGGLDLTGWDFSNQNLRSVGFAGSNLGNTLIGGAIVEYADFANTTARGFVESQLRASYSFQNRDLQGIGLSDNDLTNWDLNGQHLSHADFSRSKLADVRFHDAVVTAANFHDTTSQGFSSDQLKSTRSYQAGDLQRIGLSRNDLTNWDFSKQDLTLADFTGAKLANANLNAATVQRAKLGETTSLGLNELAFSSTDSYRANRASGN